MTPFGEFMLFTTHHFLIFHVLVIYLFCLSTYLHVSISYLLG